MRVGVAMLVMLALVLAAAPGVFAAGNNDLSYWGNDIAAHWDMDQTNPSDLTGNYSDVTRGNQAVLEPTAGIDGLGAIRLDGGADYIDTNMKIPSGDFSILLTLKSNGLLGNDGVMATASQGAAGTTDGFWMRCNGNSLNIRSYNGAGSSDDWNFGSCPENSEWQTLLLMYNDSAQQFVVYQNNILTGTRDLPFALTNTQYDFVIGVQSVNNFYSLEWDGWVDYSAVWDRMLTAKEIRETDRQNFYTEYNYTVDTLPAADSITINVSYTDDVCYQEQANVAEACGALGTGSYTVDQGPATTKTAAFLEVDYAKHPEATGALWQVKHGNLFYNITLPDECFAQDPINVRIYSWTNFSPVARASQPACYNGTAYIDVGNLTQFGFGLGGSTSDYTRWYDGDYDTGCATSDASTNCFTSGGTGGHIYEEAMFWQLTPATFTATVQGDTQTTVQLRVNTSSDQLEYDTGSGWSVVSAVQAAGNIVEVVFDYASGLYDIVVDSVTQVNDETPLSSELSKSVDYSGYFLLMDAETEFTGAAPIITSPQITPDVSLSADGTLTYSFYSPFNGTDNSFVYWFVDGIEVTPRQGSLGTLSDALVYIDVEGGQLVDKAQNVSLANTGATIESDNYGYINLSGASDIVETSGLGLNLSDDWTISFDVYWTGFGGSEGLIAFDDTNTRFIEVGTNDLYMVLQSSSYARRLTVSDELSEINTWYNVVWVHNTSDTTKLRLYIDGVEATTQEYESYGTPPAQENAELCLGVRICNNPSIGNADYPLDNVVAVQRAVSGDELQKFATRSAFRHNASQFTLTSEELAAAGGQRGDNVSVDIVPFDGSYYGQTVTYQETVGNAQPTMTFIGFGDVYPFNRNEDVIAYSIDGITSAGRYLIFNYSDPDGDACGDGSGNSFEDQGYSSTNNVSFTGRSTEGSFTCAGASPYNQFNNQAYYVKGNYFYVRVRAKDAFGSVSDSAYSDVWQVVNAPPTASAFSSTQNVTALNLQYTFNDVDGDAENTTGLNVSWTGYENISEIVPDAITNSGCSVVGDRNDASDGDFSTSYYSYYNSPCTNTWRHTYAYNAAWDTNSLTWLVALEKGTRDSPANYVQFRVYNHTSATYQEVDIKYFDDPFWSNGTLDTAPRIMAFDVSDFISPSNDMIVEVRMSYSGGNSADRIIAYDMALTSNPTPVTRSTVKTPSINAFSNQDLVQAVFKVKDLDDVNSDGSNQLYSEETYQTNFQLVDLGASITGIACTPFVYPNENNQPSTATISLNYSVGASEFVGESNTAYLELNGNTLPATCSYTGTNPRNYECNVTVNFYTPAGQYDAVVNFTTKGLDQTEVSAAACEVGELLAVQRLTNSVGFSGAAPGIQNSPSDNPVQVKNTGNKAVNLSLTAYDLDGVSTPGAQLLASYFKAGATLGSSVQLDNGVEKNLSIQVDAGASEVGNVNLWLSMPSNTVPQDYVTTTSWIVEANG